MQEPELVLEATAYTIDQLLSRDWRQIALAGRSNVGKSSLINAMARRRTLAKVSSTPGKTRSVNYYAVKPWGFYLVDLPGYGYARASHEERRKWASLLERYLKECRELVCLVLLVDGRLAPQKIDVQLAEYAKSTQFVVVTHRKGTMERCDALYGVAMQERGVSGMVSVNLQDYE